MEKGNNIKGIYILGQTERTGTNFMNKLLLLHQDINKVDHPGEDRLLTHSNLLTEYVNKTSSSWNPNWSGMDVDFFREKLFNSIQNIFESYLSDKRFVITKSPTTKGLKNFFKIFPNFKPIILIRDGRNVVESLKQSFNKPYIDSMKEWTESAERIKLFIKDNPEVLVIKYEDLNENTNEILQSIFEYLGLSMDKVNWEEVKNLPIIGSSQSSEKKGEVNWSKKLKKDSGFQPNKRFDSWSWRTKRMYNKYCGKAAIEFGYTLA